MPESPAPESPASTRWGVYVHIPWCRRRCPYCAFVLDVRRGPPHAAYTDALLRDHARQSPAFAALGRPDTLYFGGGTPSEAPPDTIARVIDTIRPRAEVTLEVNPGGEDVRAKLVALRSAGVNRLSLGVQSFQPRVARVLGRAHDAREARALVVHAQEVGFPSVSLDLMFGAPGQTLDELGADLDAALALAPHHVSLYGLTIEDGTPFARRGVAPADEDRWRDMYDLAVTRLGAGGLARYEVSNFAREGHRSVHNEHYWKARPWMGLGVGAHGWRPDGARTLHAPEVDAYLGDPLPNLDHPTREQLFMELLGAGLRHVDGVERAVVRRWTGLDIVIPEALGGLVKADGQRIWLSEPGFAVADGLACRVTGSAPDAK